MITYTVRNAEDALERALLDSPNWIPTQSRNGPVLVAPSPVATTYFRPRERVVFSPQRDANPFFHLMEALWMLAGEDDVALPALYVARMRTFSDDGTTLRGAYGHRWRHWFGFDQLSEVVRGLRADPLCRRSGVLQMWSCEEDVEATIRRSRDVPCNLIAHFQADPQPGPERRLNLVVFCRSNDAIWGAYGANAVHFSMLQEYVADRLGWQVGEYTQVSANLHFYANEQYRLLASAGSWEPRYYRLSTDDQRALVAPPPFPLVSDVATFEREVLALLHLARKRVAIVADSFREPFIARVAAPMHEAHRRYRSLRGEPARAAAAASEAAAYLADQAVACDWRTAGVEWLLRRAGS